MEVAVMVFREDLEGGSLPRAAIDAKVAEYRAKLVAESDSAAAEADRKAALARFVTRGLLDRKHWLQKSPLLSLRVFVSW